ncbi:hypothetical protein OSTOST_11283 [Ostertagia ostertagi]
MSNQALDEVLVPGSVMKPGAPYLAINGTRTFEKDDKRSIEEKVSKTLGRFLKHYGQIRRLSEGVNFGCNGVMSTEIDGRRPDHSVLLPEILNCDYFTQQIAFL